MQPLFDLCEELNVAVIGITHVNKATKGVKVLDQVNGSLGWTAGARGVLQTIDRKDGTRRLVRTKGSLTANNPDDTKGYVYRIEGVALDGVDESVASIAWGDPLDGNVEELLQDAATMVAAPTHFAQVAAVLEFSSLTITEIAGVTGLSEGQVREVVQRNHKGKFIGTGEQGSAYLYSLAA